MRGHSLEINPGERASRSGERMEFEKLGSRQVRKAVVLCGGGGTRLRPFSFSTPKHLIPCANQPVIVWIFDTLPESGIEDIAVVIGVLNEQIIRKELEEGTEYGMSLSFVVQEEPKELAHAVACAGRVVAQDPFLLHLGNDRSESGVVEIVDDFESSASHSGVARPDGRQILELIEQVTP